MRLFHRFEYRLAKEERDTHLLFERARAVLRDFRGDEQPIRFYLQEVLEERRGRMPASAIDRAVERVPKLAAHVVERPAPSDAPVPVVAGRELRRTEKLASNLQDWWYDAIPGGERGLLDAGGLSRVAEGMPRRNYRFQRAVFVFDGIDWLAAGEVPDPARHRVMPTYGDRPTVAWPGLTYFRSSVIVDWYWVGSWNHRLGLYAIVEADPAGPRVQQLPDPVARALDALGAQRTCSSQMIPSEDEKRALKDLQHRGQGVTDSVRANIMGPLEGIDLPHDLPPRNPNPADGAPVAVAKSLTRTLRPLGYQRDATLSDNTFHYYVKRTPTHNRITLEFEVGGWGADLGASFDYHGPFWRHGVPFHFVRDQTATAYVITDRETRDRVAENIAAVVQYLEARLVPPLDELYGPSPEGIDWSD
jgi:hypothetical protein